MSHKLYPNPLPVVVTVVYFVAPFWVRLICNHHLP